MRRNAFHRVLTRVPLMMFLGCQTTVPQGPLSTFCPQDTSAGSGNLDKPSGVALAVHSRGDGTTSTYAITLNPDIAQARAVDLTKALMVPAPNVYFPMAVKLGTYSEDLTVSDDGNVAVVLDADDRSLRFFDIGSEKEGNAWRKHGDVIPGLPGRASGLAVRGDSMGMRAVVSHAGDPVGGLVVVPWNGGLNGEMRRIDLGGRPTDVAITEASYGNIAIVANGGGPSVFLIDLDDPNPPALPLPDCTTTAGVRPCQLNVGGPTSDIVVGSAPGSPATDSERYPVALALRADIAAVVVIRLRYSPVGVGLPWQDRMRSDNDRVGGTVMLPSFGVASALAPNPAPQCCQGVPFQLDPAALAEGGFAYAVIALLNGSVAYLDLDARDVNGRRTPRLVDTNSTPPGPERDESCNVIDVNTDTVNYTEPGVADGGVLLSGKRPTAQLELFLGDVTSDPPVVNQNLTDDYDFQWEGVLVGVDKRRAISSPAQLTANILQDARTDVNLAALDVQPGDVVVVPPQAHCPCPVSDPECTVAQRLVVVGAAGSTIEVSSTFAARNCLSDPDGVIYSIRAANAFTLRGEKSGRTFGRAHFFEPVVVPGLRMTLRPAGWVGSDPDPVGTHGGETGNGPVGAATENPPPVDSILVVPMRSNFDPFILNLNDTDPTAGRYIPAGTVPTGIVTAAAPVKAASGSGVESRAIGVLSATGGKLLLQFDLAVYPSCASPGTATCISQTQCTPNVSRSNLDPSFRFFE